LVDHLLGLGYLDLTAIDLSATALQTVRDRLGPAGAAVKLELADVLDLRSERRYALWHDRAVFHFLTEPDERDDYRASLARVLSPGGRLVVATFGPDGPLTCSGLPIVRYSHEQLAAEFPGFDLVATSGEDHLTSWGATQQFSAVLLRHRG
jgi:SAM-dependent methyltransferase